MRSSWLRLSAHAIAVVAVATLLFGVGACSAPAPARASDAAPSGVLRWGGDAEGGAPFVEADPAHPDSMRGFDVEIADMIAAGLGRTPQFVQVAYASIAASVERGDFDVGLSGVEDRPDLRARHSLSLPYFEFREVLAVRLADSARYRTLADLTGKRVGTLGATTAYDMLLEAQQASGVVADLLRRRRAPVHRPGRRAARRGAARPRDRRAGAAAAGGLLHRAGGRWRRGFYVGVFARGDSALRDSADTILRARMRDGSLEATFRRWNVWDDQQRAHFARVVAAGSGMARSRRRAATTGASRATSPPCCAAPVSRSCSPAWRWRSPWRSAYSSQRGACTDIRSCARCSRSTSR